MFDIVFLGTSASAPSVHRGLSAAAVMAEDMRFLVDCGEGTQRQILRSGIGFKRLNHILITHAHLDHILGLGGFVSTLARWESVDEIHIWGSPTVLERVDLLVNGVALRGQSAVDVRFHEVAAGEVYSHRKFTVTAFPVVHRGRGCFGYRFEERAHRPFLAAEADALGVPFGPERAQLIRGEAITTPAGQVITPEMVLGTQQTGTSVAFTGDIARTNNIVDAVADVDLLVTESTFIDADREMARQFGHITARQAAELARDAGAKHLILTHLSRRYRASAIREEAQAVFPGAIVAHDLDQYRIRRGQPMARIEEKRNDDERNPAYPHPGIPE
jgi:ribonuclease Z